jgi:hypothetical protein
VSLHAKLAEIRTRLEAATPGPWQADTAQPGDAVVWAPSRGDVDSDTDLLCNVGPSRHGEAMVAFDFEAADAEFIAHARQDVDYLLRCVEDGAVPGPARQPAGAADLAGWFSSSLASTVSREARALDGTERFYPWLQWRIMHAARGGEHGVRITKADLPDGLHSFTLHGIANYSRRLLDAGFRVSLRVEDVETPEVEIRW